MSNFPFITDRVLKNNLDIAFDHILELSTITDNYENTLKSSFRKTIIIYTASIIEALLLYMIKQKISKNKITIKDEWKYYNIKIIYKILEKNEEVISCFRKKETKKIDNLDYFKVSRICLNNKIISKSFFEEINKVRNLRNRLHIGGLKEIEKEYSDKDLNFVFSVAKRTKNIASKI